MSNYSENGFYAQHYNTIIEYKDYLIDYELIKIKDFQKEIVYCKNGNDYVRKYIEHIKDNVIKKVKNLNDIKIELSTYDSYNKLHRLIFKIVYTIKEFLDIKNDIIKIGKDKYMKKHVIIVIKYDNTIIHVGNLNFYGID
jgi:hypothetical protein